MKIRGAKGASIAYTTEEWKDVRWRLYPGELTLALPAALRDKACRLGYLDSREVARRYQ